MASSMVDVNDGWWIQSWVNGEPHQTLGGRSSQINCQGKIVQSINYYYSSILMGVNWWDKKKNSSIERLPWLFIKPYVQVTSPFTQEDIDCVRLRLELWPLSSKNQLQNSNSDPIQNYFDAKTVHKSTFNVRTLTRICQLPEVTVSAAEHNIDTICICGGVLVV